MTKIILRSLRPEDANLMLDWMHDSSVVQFMGTNFMDKTLADCEAFIRKSQADEENLHLAVVDENNEYLGTVSLKNINKEKGCAEFAITICAAAMGKGISKRAMDEIIRIAFEEMNLKLVYWYVSPENKRAIRFYDKNGYQRVEEKLGGGGYTQQRIVYLVSNIPSIGIIKLNMCVVDPHHNIILLQML